MTVPLCVPRACAVRERVLVTEVQRLEGELALAEEALEMSRAGASLATAAAETEVRALRTQVQNVVVRQHSQQKLWAERREQEVQRQVEIAVQRVRSEALAAAEAREAEHRAEVNALHAALANARKAHGEFESSLASTLSKQGADLLSALSLSVEV